MLSLLLSCLLAAPIDTLAPDGPYLFYQGDSIVAEWVDTENRKKGTVGFRPENFGALPNFATFRPELVDPERAFVPTEIVQFDGVKSVVALSDIHGQYETGKKLLVANGIIDAQQHWIFGEGHLVFVGDIFDRGDQVTELLWLVHNLQIEAERAGGKVHFLLGNHETMTLEGDDRYLNQRYRVTSGLTGRFYKELYGPDSYLGRWLRSLPLAVQINDAIYVHGGLSREVVRQVSSLERLNELYHDYLIDANDLSEMLDENARMELLHGNKGPLWYRGYFTRREFTGRDLSYILKRLKASRIVVGHTSFTAVQGFYDNRIIAVDSSIKFGGAGELLLIEDGRLHRGNLHGERLELAPSK